VSWLVAFAELLARHCQAPTEKGATMTPDPIDCRIYQEEKRHVFLVAGWIDNRLIVRAGVWGILGLEQP
jgi:hypothetical protein